MNNIISILVNGIKYTGWTANTIFKSLETLSNSFNISLTPKFKSDGFIDNIPIDVNDEIQVLIDNELVINGFIDSRKTSYSHNKHSINITGRSRICDLVDSDLVGNLNLNKGYRVSTLIQKILNNLGLTNIKIFFVNVSDDIYDEDFNCGRGENAWKVLNDYLQKKSIYAMTDGNSDILLYRGSFGNTNKSLFHTKNKPELNNILSGVENKNNIDRFYSIKVISQLEANISSDNFENQTGTAFDKNIRTTRKREILSRNSLTSKECLDLAKFETNIRKAKGFSYDYTIYGYRQSENGLLWSTNYLIGVKDDYFFIDDYFLIESVEFTKDLNGGSITNLTLVDKNSYTILEPKIEKSTNQLIF